MHNRFSPRGVVAAIAASALLLTLSGTTAAAAEPSSAQDHALRALLAKVNAIAAQPSGPTTFIVGGENATKLHGEVSIQADGRHRCGGDLITRKWVISAAHCSVVMVPGAEVRSGSLDWTTGGELTGFNLVKVQPDYTGEVFANDFVLIRLNKRVKANPVGVGLHPGKVGTNTKISGWGKICDTDLPECSTLPNQLQQLDTKLTDPARCMPEGAVTEDGTPWFNPESEYCVVSADAGYEMACNGDSGGPLRRWSGGQQVLIGVTSGDGDDLGPRVNDCVTNPNGGAGVGVWGRVAAQVRWIVSTLWRHDRAAAYEFVGLLRP